MSYIEPYSSRAPYMVAIGQPLSPTITSTHVMMVIKGQLS